MKIRTDISLPQVQAVYDGPEGDLWELVMGEQVHIGGFASSMALAQAAGIGKGMRGIDLCCCNGAGMRFLIRFRQVAAMQGVDATARSVSRCRARTAAEKLDGRIRVVEADACASGLPDGEADFVWGEDAWCYVEDKSALIAEATRLVKAGGTIAFTDWVEGEALYDADAFRFLGFMKFPSLLTIREYASLLERSGCEVLCAEDTGQFTPHVDLYLDMLNRQLTYDALRCIGYDRELMDKLGGEMLFTRQLASSGKIAQGRFVARKLG
ncbi:MAG: methyltransferase domain-containing protein [Kiritimatiellae bacterium]|nr:methyltransferase domain-containing protein [Kiritimatiellia bacterium]